MSVGGAVQRVVADEIAPGKIDSDVGQCEWQVWMSRGLVSGGERRKQRGGRELRRRRESARCSHGAIEVDCQISHERRGARAGTQVSG